MDLTPEEVSFLLSRFESLETSTAHSGVWRKRSYAPMLIHEAELQRLHRIVDACFPDYTIAFDVIFDSDGKEVGWHCDYESLGPFCVPSFYRAIRDRHFVSIHFNLTPDGGSLETLDWLHMSWCHYMCIVTFGIFSVAHHWLVVLSGLVFCLCARRYKNGVGNGNVFNNMALHRVTAGKSRTSYVLRLVKRNVFVTKESVVDGISRSSACAVFSRLLHLFHTKDVYYAHEIEWCRIFSSRG